MATYLVNVSVTISKNFEVEAESQDHAEELALNEAECDSAKNLWTEESEYHADVVTEL